MSKEVRLGLLGIGGWAEAHLGVISTLQDAGICKLVAVADPYAAKKQEYVNSLQANDVVIYDDADKLFARDDIEAVIIVTPIHLHASQTIAAFESGKHVYLEKPPAATLEQHAQMMTAQQASGKVGMVGFQMQTTPFVQFVKRQLLSGELGELETVWASTRWRRDDAYYTRSIWAGKWEVNGMPVYDGPATNALAHVVHASLFLAGTEQHTWADIARVRGVLKKARPIECFDTSYMEAETTSGASVRLALTHAAASTDAAMLRCACTNGNIQVDWGGNVVIEKNGEEPKEFGFPYLAQAAAILDLVRAIREPGHQPFTTFADTLPYMQTVVGAARSSNGSSDFDPALVTYVSEDGAPGHYQVQDMDDQFLAFRADREAIPAVLNVDSAPWVSAADLASA